MINLKHGLQKQFQLLFEQGSHFLSFELLHYCLDLSPDIILDINIHLSNCLSDSLFQFIFLCNFFLHKVLLNILQSLDDMFVDLLQLFTLYSQLFDDILELKFLGFLDFKGFLQLNDFQTIIARLCYRQLFADCRIYWRWGNYLLSIIVCWFIT